MKKLGQMLERSGVDVAELKQEKINKQEARETQESVNQIALENYVTPTKMIDVQNKRGMMEYIDAGVMDTMSTQQARDHVNNKLFDIIQAEDWDLYPGEQKSDSKLTRKEAEESAENIRVIAKDLHKSFHNSKFAKLSEMSSVKQTKLEVTQEATETAA